MPELPEIEVLKGEIKARVVGRQIVTVDVSDPNVINMSPEMFVSTLARKKITGAGRRGKMLLIYLEEGLCLIIHFMLFGRIRLSPEVGEGAQVVLNLDDRRCLFFSQLALGAGVHLHQGEEIDSLPQVTKLGVDALSRELDFEQFTRMISRSKAKIKALLMDQSFISGIGNTYADEILFEAKINPERSGKSLGSEEILAVYRPLKNMLMEAITAGGARLDDFAHLDGSKGGFIPKVHGLEDKPCPVCGLGIRKTKVGGRGTYYCPQCQNYFRRSG